MAHPVVTTGGNLVRIGQQSPARYLAEARREVPPEEFAIGVRKVWAAVMERGDVKAFLAVAPYLVGEVKRQEGEAPLSVIDQFVQVMERRQQLLAAQEQQLLAAQEQQLVLGEQEEPSDDESA